MELENQLFLCCKTKSVINSIVLIKTHAIIASTEIQLSTACNILYGEFIDKQKVFYFLVIKSLLEGTIRVNILELAHLSRKYSLFPLRCTTVFDKF